MQSTMLLSLYHRSSNYKCTGSGWHILKLIWSLAATMNMQTIFTLCLKTDTDVAHYNFNAQQPILVIFWQTCCWQSMLSNGDLLSHLSWLMFLHYLGKHEPWKLCLFSHAVYRISKMTLLRHSSSQDLPSNFTLGSKEQLSAAEFWDSNGHNQRWGER